MRPKVQLLLMILVLFASPYIVSSQSSWDLSILRVTVFPPDAEVQQGQPLLLTIYVGNNEQSQFSGTITVSLYVDGFIFSKENWLIGNISMGSVPIPSGGYRTIVTSLDTSKLTLGVHELTIELAPKEYVDPRMSDNRYSLNFIVVPLVNPFIEMRGELVQGEECDISVHVPNPRSEPFERVRVRLIINGSDVGIKEIYVPPKSISEVKFYYKPMTVGELRVEALLMKDDQLLNRAVSDAVVRPSCDLEVAGIQIGERIFVGEPISGKLRIQNKGLSGTGVNITISLDGNASERKVLDLLGPGNETDLDFALGVKPLSVGTHVITVRADPLDAVDLNPADNELSISFRVMPVPVSLSSRVRGGDVELNLTNLGDVIADLELSVVRNGSEVRRMNLTLEAGGSMPVLIRGLEPGNYTIVVYSHGSAVASTEVSLEGRGIPLSELSPLWLIAVVPIVGALVYYLIHVRGRRKRWPS
ncbi:MAG: hypothetical protein BA066_02635 [Candidatus Korarchaeota archaeon NZ13-K]|nr:MAG: hypothetical protein BA066_02635 [Candidatus Korarchaeota archaeon NZ13-K]